MNQGESLHEQSCQTGNSRSATGGAISGSTVPANNRIPTSYHVTINTCVAQFHRSLTADQKAGLEMLKQHYQSSQDNKAKAGYSKLEPINLDDLRPVLKCKNFEEVFEVPAGSVVISRSAFPLGNKEENWAKVTSLNCGGWGAIETGKYTTFARALKTSVGTSINSKLNLYLTEKVKTSPITIKNRQVRTIAELFTSWTTENVTREKCEHIFSILYGSLERDNIFAEIHLQVLLEHGLYFSNADDGLSNRVKKGGRVRQSCIWQTIKNKMRDLFRNKYSRTEKIPHGIRINVTNKDVEGRSKRNNKKGEFIFSENVKGWQGPKHIAFMKRLDEEKGEGKRSPQLMDNEENTAGSNKVSKSISSVTHWTSTLFC